MIKFRAWDKDENRYFIDGKAGRLGNLICCNDWDMFDPDDYVWEQFTGLKDANGKDIYEGDIVRLADDLDNPYKVIFDEAKFEFSGSRFCYDFGEAFMDCEIIGNIHENPGLMEAGK